jgi:hypothetical protein
MHRRRFNADSKARENEKTKSKSNQSAGATLAIRVMALLTNQITLSLPIKSDTLISFVQASPFLPREAKRIKARVRVKVSVPFSFLGVVNLRDEFDGWNWWRVD